MTSDDIREQKFTRFRRAGYRSDEVDAFMRQIMEDYERMEQQTCAAQDEAARLRVLVHDLQREAAEQRRQRDEAVRQLEEAVSRTAEPPAPEPSSAPGAAAVTAPELPAEAPAQILPAAASSVSVQQMEELITRVLGMCESQLPEPSPAPDAYAAKSLRALAKRVTDVQDLLQHCAKQTEQFALAAQNIRGLCMQLEGTAEAYRQEAELYEARPPRTVTEEAAPAPRKKAPVRKKTAAKQASDGAQDAPAAGAAKKTAAAKKVKEEQPEQ